MNIWIIIGSAFAYLALLFGIAQYSENKAKEGKSIVNNPYVYALSLAVYCTAWTYYGSVGKAASDGIGFLPIYIGPLLMTPILYFLLRKIIHISNHQRLTSIADFIASRYGKSTRLGIIVTIIAISGIIPYISIQLKAIASSIEILSGQELPNFIDGKHFYGNTAFYVTVILALFTIFFGTRRLDATERHEGLVAAVAFESIVKLVAFLAVGLFVTYGVYDGFGDIFQQASVNEATKNLLEYDGSMKTSNNWLWLTIISMFAILCLPRQFHISVVENFSPSQVNKAIWIFPLYLFIINIFVIPIALGGMLTFPDGVVNADTFVLNMPIYYDNKALALLVFIGGLSAASSMVIVSTIALSIMISNNLVTPILVQTSVMKDKTITDISKRFLNIRRLSIVFVLLFAYAYFSLIDDYTLVSIGLISFVAVAQFAPPLIGGLFWKTGNKTGAISGLLAGAVIWSYTLVLPTLVESGMIHQDILEYGLMGFYWLKPTALFGIENMDAVSQAAFWSLFFNITTYITVSLNTTQTALESTQADLFVNIQKYTSNPLEYQVVKRKASIEDVTFLLERFVGPVRTAEILEEYAKKLDVDLSKSDELDADFVNQIEALLSGAIGVSSARSLISSIVKEDPISVEEVMQILGETQDILRYSKALEKKSNELEQISNDLKAANERMKELDQLKDDFISTITHELRTPITSIKAFAKILKENQLTDQQQDKFLGIVVNESERIARLVNQVLDLKKMQTEQVDYEFKKLNLIEIVEQSVASLYQSMDEKRIKLHKNYTSNPISISGDKDKLIQVIVNLLSNAIKFCDASNGIISISIFIKNNQSIIQIKDNGLGIPKDRQQDIFDRFTQIGHKEKGKPTGSGLGLFISKVIVEQHQGIISVESEPNQGATFIIQLPLNS
jgi:Na+/proline symporter/nitrogen-specific signal transduction histidine kinase